MDAAGVTRTEESFRGKTIWRLGESEDDEAAYYTLDDEVLVVAGGGRSLLEKFIVMRTEGGLPSLSESPGYRRIWGRLGEDEDVVAYVNVAAMLEQIPAASAAGPGQMASGGPKEWLDALGLMDVQGLAMSCKMMEAGMRTQGLLLAPAPRRGILKAFEPEYVDLDPPAFVAGDASMFGAGYFDLATLLQEIMTALQTMNPMMYQMAQMQMNNPQLGIDFQRDVVEALGNRWFVYQPAEAVTANPPVMTNRAMVFELKKPDAFAAAFQKLLAMAPPGMLTPVDYEGYTVYQFPATSMDPDLPGTEPTVAFVEDKLLVALNLALAKTIINDNRPGRSALLKNEDFQRAASQALPDAHLVLYADARTAGKAQWQQAQQMLEMMFQLQLPSWEVLSKYQSVSLTTAKWMEDGLLMKAWEPFPAGAE